MGVRLQKELAMKGLRRVVRQTPFKIAAVKSTVNAMNGKAKKGLRRVTNGMK